MHLLLCCVLHSQWLLQLFPFQVNQVICGFCVTLFFLVCFICIVEIFVPRVSSFQSLTLGTSVLPCGISEHLMPSMPNYSLMVPLYLFALSEDCQQAIKIFYLANLLHFVGFDSNGGLYIAIQASLKIIIAVIVAPEELFSPLPPGSIRPQESLSVLPPPCLLTPILPSELHSACFTGNQRLPGLPIPVICVGVQMCGQILLK